MQTIQRPDIQAKLMIQWTFNTAVQTAAVIAVGMAAGLILFGLIVGLVLMD